MVPATLGAYRQAWRQNIAFPRDWREKRDRGDAILTEALTVRSNVWDVVWVAGGASADLFRIAKCLIAKGYGRYAEALLVRVAESTTGDDLRERHSVVNTLLRIRAGHSALGLLREWLGLGRRRGAPDLSAIQRLSLLELEEKLPLFLAAVRACEQIGDQQAALATSEGLCTRIDLTKHPAIVLALSKRYVAQKRPGDAIAWLERWQTKRLAVVAPWSTGERELVQQLASLYVRAGRHEDAAAAYESLIPSARNAHEAAWCASQMAACYFALRRPRQAVAACEAVVQRHPDCAHAHYVLGLSLRRTRDTSGAVKALEAAVRLAPGHALYSSHLAAARREHDQASR